MSVLLHGFYDPITWEIIRRGLDVRVWVRPGGQKSALWRRLNDDAGQMRIIKGREFIEKVCEDEISHILPAELYERLRTEAFHAFMRCHARRYQCRIFRREFVFHEHMFMLFAMRAYNLLKKHGISLLAFAQVPHKGSDIVMYHLARLMGLKTILCLQNPALGVDYFTLVSCVEDIGVHARGLPRDPLPVDCAPPTRKPFYMQRYRHKYRYATKELIQAIGSTARAFLTLRSAYSRHTAVDKVCRAARRLHYLRYTPAQAASTELVAGLIADSVPYVYVPLHLEPEMVIDVLGGRYREQALFVRKLRERLPEDVHIIVKDNPAQTSFARDDAFYQAITTLPNVHYLKEDMDTFRLIEGALAVAAVLGTAGWEALRYGKPVIIGGHAWYGGLPGVYRVDDVRYEDLSAFTFSPERLQKAAREMSRHYRRGIPAEIEYYATVLGGLDKQANARSVAADIVEYAHFLLRSEAGGSSHVQ